MTNRFDFDMFLVNGLWRLSEFHVKLNNNRLIILYSILGFRVAARVTERSPNRERMRSMVW